MTLYEMTLPQLVKMLTNMKGWLEDAEKYAEERGFSPDNFLGVRLYVDQFNLTRNVQSACDNAKGIAARMSGKTAPRHEDNEATFEELKARVDKVLAYLGEFSPGDFDGWEDRVVPLPFIPGGNKGATAGGYLAEFGLPNFYFHVNMVYASLRHSGVKLGKLRYIGGMNLLDL